MSGKEDDVENARAGNKADDECHAFIGALSTGTAVPISAARYRLFARLVPPSQRTRAEYFVFGHGSDLQIALWKTVEGCFFARKIRDILLHLKADAGTAGEVLFSWVGETPWDSHGQYVLVSTYQVTGDGFIPGRCFETLQDAANQLDLGILY